MSEWRTDDPPENGTLFWYFSRGKVRLGSLGHDLGGSIKRDADMTHWMPMEGRHKALPPDPPTDDIRAIGAQVEGV